MTKLTMTKLTMDNGCIALSTANRAKGAVALLSAVSALALTATLGSAALATVAAAGPIITPTPVSACGPLSTPGSYALTANLGPVAGTCLIISAPHVTLDLAGHTVTGMKLGTSAGIEIVPGARYATVESTQPGGAILAFHAGVQDYADLAVIKGPDLMLADNAGAGVYLYRVVGSVVEGAQLDGNGYFGANVDLSRGVVLQSNQVEGNATYGIWAQSSSASRFVQDLVVNSGLAGIYLGCSYTANLQEIGCRPSDGNLIAGNILTGNGPFGIAIADESLGNRIDGNRASADARAGLWDENAGCAGPSAPPNSWLKNTGTRNQSVSVSCIG
jgi:parallel beta-helix repeat protein